MCSLLHALYVWDAAQNNNYQIIGHVFSQCMLSPSGGHAILADSGEIFPLDLIAAHSVHTCKSKILCHLSKFKSV